MGGNDSKPVLPEQEIVHESVPKVNSCNQLPKKKIKLLIHKVEEQKILNAEIIKKRTSYTAEEVSTMDDYILCSEFMRITGKKSLSCKHCNGEKPILTNWMVSIRKRCMKDGLSVTMKVPKTCDKQQARNMVCNPVNNPAYSKLRNETVKNDEKKIIIKERQEKLKKVGIQTRPYRYT